MNSQTNDPILEWRSKDFVGLPRDAAQQIIVTAWDEKNRTYQYNIVAYHAPMELWYGGPGILVTEDEVQYWAKIPGPPEPTVDPDD
ncbi:hypothetical protein [Rhizobium sophorae]|uniref:hypothetical protein n=1 Tax=Rhizobium sophorae TaxID=1535242 RepID=UPI001AED7212|nr:hypothetical protein [Rhizobium sophorae]